MSGLARAALAVVASGSLDAHLRCPHARLWLEHGAERAAEMLGMPSGMPAHRTSGAACSIAEGFPGGAHQNAASPGYSTNCSGAPAQASPYMWPLDFFLEEENTIMNFDSDEPVAQYKSQTWYLLSKNWKRSDLREGKKPGRPGTGTGDMERTTFLHRNENLVYLQWAEGADFRNVSQILSCTSTKVGGVGNIRPDWFLDSRPYSSPDIASQYLGNQHIMHEGKATLVRQWRKSDFVENYFVMSMQEHPDSSGVRWPLQIAIPGEAEGPDTLRVMSKHRLLNASELEPFLIDQAYMAAGGECRSSTPAAAGTWVCGVCAKEYLPEEDGEGLAFEDLPEDWVCPRCGSPKSAFRQAEGSAALPLAPLAAAEVVPSALTKDSTFWRDIEYTFSPYAPLSTTTTTTVPAGHSGPTCSVCGHEYDAVKDGQGTPFSDLPDDWVCPVCGSPKSAFTEGAIQV